MHIWYACCRVIFSPLYLFLKRAISSRILCKRNIFCDSPFVPIKATTLLEWNTQSPKLKRSILDWNTNRSDRKVNTGIMLSTWQLITMKLLLYWHKNTHDSTCLNTTQLGTYTQGYKVNKNYSCFLYNKILPKELLNLQDLQLKIATKAHD